VDDAGQAGYGVCTAEDATYGFHWQLGASSTLIEPFLTVVQGTTEDMDFLVGSLRVGEEWHPARWDAETGVLDVQQYLLDRGENLDGWILGSALAVSEDGSVIRGRGSAEDGWQAYELHLPLGNCLWATDCDLHADCTPVGMDHVCTCQEGYAGDGHDCVDVDECQALDCGEHEECLNRCGPDACTCSPGYVRDTDGCVPCDESPMGTYEMAVTVTSEEGTTETTATLVLEPGYVWVNGELVAHSISLTESPSGLYWDVEVGDYFEDRRTCPFVDGFRDDLPPAIFDFFGAWDPARGLLKLEVSCEEPTYDPDAETYYFSATALGTRTHCE
jgi:hypothetical protein